MALNLTSLILALGAKKSGEGYVSKCPAHEDGVNSFSFREGRSGKLIVHCHAGCTYEQVRNALEKKGLMEESNSQKSTSKKSSVGKIVNVYSYKDEDGTELYQKLRYEPKAFRHRSVSPDGGWSYSMGKTRRVLYALPAIVATKAQGTPIAICEGEKDCHSLIDIGLDVVATTNSCGAVSWHQGFNEHLTGRDIIIFQDNDKAGIERTEMLLRNLKGKARSIKVIEFSELEQKQDVSDFIELDKDSALARVTAKIEKAKAIDAVISEVAWTGPLGAETAEYKEYIDFIYSLKPITKVVRCALTNELMVKDEAGNWDYAHNWLSYIKGHARTYGDYFTLDAFDQYIERHRIDDKKKELRVSIPEWDGVDRIEEQARKFRFSNVTWLEFADLVKQWGAGVFRRLDDPGYQNPCLILQGPQGCGKDTLIESWIGGLDDYRKDLNISQRSDAEEIKKSLHTALVFVIPEFEKAAKVDQASLREVIHKSYTDVRLSYDKRSSKRAVHASFVASCNSKDVFADTTGNRRYWLIECEYLGLELTKAEPIIGTGKVIDSYPGIYCRKNMKEERLQILAQFRALANDRFQASEKTLDKMRNEMAERTPQSTEDMIKEAWENEVRTLASTHVKDGYNYFDLADIQPQVLSIMKRFGLRSETRLRRVLAEDYQKQIWDSNRKQKVRMFSDRKHGTAPIGWVNPWGEEEL